MQCLAHRKCNQVLLSIIIVIFTEGGLGFQKVVMACFRAEGFLPNASQIISHGEQLVLAIDKAVSGDFFIKDGLVLRCQACA